MLEKNVSESHRVCSSVVLRVFAPLEKALEDGIYMRPGGYQEFCGALRRGAQLYRLEKRKGVVAEEVLLKYLKDKNAVKRSILAADRSLTEAQQKAEEGRMQREEAEQQQKILEHVNQIQEQIILDQKRSNEENIRQLEMKMERERQRAQQELQRVVTAKLKEQKRLLELGFNGRARDMEEDIRKLRQEQSSVGQKKKSSLLKKLGSGMQAVGLAAAAFAPGFGTIVGLGTVAVGSILKIFS
ncbi:hypothetical protein ACEWY4_005097 [Coilia grayii]|uniref:Guanylate-binding protein/Atlastin C-terminal domain-containing protein n=1 Tax=Coilia grayii TaxID=363190 RepID=A0ABD1KHF2_9TELE